MRLSARKPKNSAYPQELEMLGDHVRARRLDLGMLQREVAQILGVDVDSVCGWETGRSQPKVYLLPRIIEFLGYAPGHPATSFPAALRIARRSAGLSQERLAQRVGVNESSIAKWERGEAIPFPASVERIRRFFDKIGAPLADFGPEAFYSPNRGQRRRARRGEPVAR